MKSLALIFFALAANAQTPVPQPPEAPVSASDTQATPPRPVPPPVPPPATVPGAVRQPAAPTGSANMVSLQFPNNPVTDIASYYELLTKKTLIRDANLAGPNLAIVVPQPVTREQAIALIESALLLNGYALVPVDATTSKLLGPTKQPKNESIPLFANAADLPGDDQVVSFFMPLSFLSSEEAARIFSSYVALRPFGSIVPAPNVNALIITENVPLVRRLIDLQRVIDVPGARAITEFFSLKRADATKVADIMKLVFEKRDGLSAAAAPNPEQNGQPPVPQVPGQPSLPSAAVAAQVEVKIVPDPRTNRVMVIAPEQQMPYIRELVANLDVGVAFEEPLERPLRFVAAGDVLPVLANLLAEGEDKENSNAEGNTGQNTQGSDQNSGFSQTSGGSSGSGGNGGSKPDKLRDPSQNTAPQSLIVGNARIIADRSSNKIIVIGPPESRAKAARVLDMLDRRPKQIYLATVIGQLALTDGLNLGIQWPGSITAKMFIRGSNGNGNASTTVTTTTDANGNVITNPDNGTIVNNNGGIDALPGTGELVNTAVNLFAGGFSGLAVYGVIADSLDVTVNALQSEGEFKVISRPVVYTANNKKAVISSGQQVPVPGTSLTSSLSVGAQGTSVASTIEYKDVVLKLEVIPLINSNNEVTLTIAQQNDNVQETVTIAENQVPVIGTQELTTTVTVPNRHTVVLGGLITEEKRVTKSGLPLLSDIPGLGYLFGSKETNIVRRELIIMIQPFIIDDDQQLYEANYIERANSGFSNDMFEGELPVLKATLPDASPTPRPKTNFPAWQSPR